MKNLTGLFTQLYDPQKILVMFEARETYGRSNFVEVYDIDEEGLPINPHPLSSVEEAELIKSLQTAQGLSSNFLKPRRLLPGNVLYIDPSVNGFCIWHTPARTSSLLFSPHLEIPSGMSLVPPLIWKASRTSVSIYAIAQVKKPKLDTRLLHAPFPNVYNDGQVCMGTVNIDFPAGCCLEDFITRWEQYFFHSEFSHWIAGAAYSGEMLTLWQSLVETGATFPIDKLISHHLKLEDLLYE